MAALKQKGRLTGVYRDDRKGASQFRDWGGLGGYPAVARVPLPQQLGSGEFVTKPSAEELGLMSRPPKETCYNVGAACPESVPLRDASSAGGPSSPRDLPEPRVSTEHTNNRIGESACFGRSSAAQGQMGDEYGALGPGRDLETLEPKGPAKERHRFFTPI